MPEALTLEMVAALFRANPDITIGTRGRRIAFMNPAAQRFFGGDLTGQSASALLPESVLQTQTSTCAASATIRGRRAVLTASAAGIYRLYYITFPDRKTQGIPVPEQHWSVLSNLGMLAGHFMRDARERGSEKDIQYACKLTKCYYQLHRWFMNMSTLHALEQNTLPFQPEALNCAELLRRMAGSTEFFTQARGIQVLTDLPEQMPPCLLDGELMERMMLNLLLNSLLHCDEGGRVRLGLHLTRQDLVITVHDTGSGIPPERLGELFSGGDVRSARDEDEKAAGYGLAVASGIAALHGGRMLVESTDHIGTTVKVMLPRKEPGELKFRTTPPDDMYTYRTRVLSGLSDFLTDEDFLEEMPV